MQARGQLRLTWRLYAESPQSGEISPLLWYGRNYGRRSLDSEYHRSGSRLSPIPARTSARDDDVGERPSRHFDRSVAEWRNLLPLMARAALRQEISRLRVSSERFPSAPYRHTAPLEMTMLASAPLVISTEAKRSGEISPSDGTGGIMAGDLSTQSIIGAVPVCLPYRHVPPLEMTMLSSAPPVISTEAKRSGEISRPKWQKSRPAPSVISTKALRSGEISFLPWYMKHGGRKSPGSESP